MPPSPSGGFSPRARALLSAIGREPLADRPRLDGVELALCDGAVSRSCLAFSSPSPDRSLRPGLQSASRSLNRLHLRQRIAIGLSRDTVPPTMRRGAPTKRNSQRRSRSHAATRSSSWRCRPTKRRDELAMTLMRRRPLLRAAAVAGGPTPLADVASVRTHVRSEARPSDSRAGRAHPPPTSSPVGPHAPPAHHSLRRPSRRRGGREAAR